ncbi:DUF2807 domain-containing protein [bacterium]|nr:DUF2807 domain-containing protein [bacterium]
MKNFLVIALSIFAIFLIGCNEVEIEGSEKSKTEIRKVDSFDKISIGGNIVLNIMGQKEQSLSITGEDNILPLILTEVKDKTLRIYSSKTYQTHQAIEVNIKIISLKTLDISGVVQGTISNLKEDSFELRASGASQLIMSGNVKNVHINSSGAVMIQAQNLKTKSAKIDLSGTGKIEIHSEESLDITLSGMGMIHYYGNPKSIKQDISGMGKLIKK